MTTLYLLWRKMSEYTSNPLWLGVFDSKEKAEAAQREYISAPSGCPTKPDPHADQAYYDVDLKHDVKIKTHNVPGEVKAEVVLVERVESAMFGQGSSNIQSIWPSRRQAKREVGRCRKEEKARCQKQKGIWAIEDGFRLLTMNLNWLYFPGRNE